MARSTSWNLLALAGVIGAGCTSGKDAGLDTGFGSTSTSGYIYKGPLERGGTVELTPLADDLTVAGDTVTVSIESDDGGYSAVIPYRGLVKVSASGYALDEASGGQSDGAISLNGYAILSEDSQPLQINLLTDLTSRRVEALIATGVAPADAIAQAQDELVASIHIGSGAVPGQLGADLDPYGGDFDQAWLFAVSAIIATAGDAMDKAGEGDLGELMSNLRDDLADDGALSQDAQELIYDTEANMDPDLATLALTATLKDAGTGRTLPDIHPALDSDHDGITNDLDNCRYVANADQAASEGEAFGDACDYRLLSIAANDSWGCGVLQRDGSIVCWSVAAPPSGGTPPAPDVYPSHPGTPWDGEDKLQGAYTSLSVGQAVTCAIAVGGAEVDCDVDGVDDQLVLTGDFAQVSASSTLICTLDSYGGALCVDTTGAEIASDPGPFAQIEAAEDGSVLTLSAETGELAWLSYDGGPADLPSLPDGAFDHFSNGNERYGCAVSAAGGSLSCWGDSGLAGGEPSGTYKDVAVGDGVACVTNADGALSCWWDDDLCSQEGDLPPNLWNLHAGGCQVCGVDQLGIGRCFPRYWDQTHG